MSTTKRRKTKGTGSIYRSGGQWVAQVRATDPLTGKKLVRRRKRQTREQARQALEELQATPIAVSSQTEWTLQGWIQHWRETHLPRRDNKQRTKDTYALWLRLHAEPVSGTIKLTDFHRAEAELWLERLTERTGRKGTALDGSAVRQTLIAARHALDTAVEHELIPTNPLKAVKPPTVGKREVPATGADELAKTLTACKDDERLHDMVLFVGNTGCRLSEMLNLQWKDLDLATGAATLRRGGSDQAGNKGGKQRTVSLVPDVVTMLQLRRSAQRLQRLAMGPLWHDHDLVFSTRNGKPLSARNAYRALHDVKEQAGLTPARPWHSLRHGLSHRLLKAGVPMPMVSAMLGHSSIQITVDTYGHIESAVPADVLSAALATAT